MAQLKDLLVNGVSRLVGDVFLDKLNAPTTSTGNNFGLGTSGNILRTNGNNIYWDNVLDTAHGGTGVTNHISPHYVFVGPSNDNDNAGSPSFRELVEGDIPTLSPSKSGLGNAKIFYGTCATAAAAKVVTCSSFTTSDLVAGTIIFITFSATNTGAVASLTLNINGTGAKNIKFVSNETIVNLILAGWIEKNTTHRFVYNGTYWIVSLDNVIKQTATTTSSWRKVLLHATESAATTTAVATISSNAYAAVGVSVQPSTGTLAATKFQGNGSALTNLNASNVASGTLSTSYGGTGVSTAAANTIFAGPASGSNAAPEFRDLTIDDIKGLTIGYCDSAGTDTTKVIKLNIDNVSVGDQFIFYLKNNNSTSNSSSTNLSLTINNNINCDMIYDENISTRLTANATLPKGYYALRIVQKTGLWALKPIPIDYKNVSANTVFAGPSNSDGIPSFRALTASDLPDNMIINQFYIQNYGWQGFILPNNSNATNYQYRTFQISTAIDPNLPQLYQATATLVNSTNGSKKAFLGIPLNNTSGWYANTSMIFNTGTSIENISSFNNSNNVFLFSNCLLWVLLDNIHFTHTTYNNMVEIGWYLTSDTNGYPTFTSGYTNNITIGRVLDKISVPAGYSVTFQPNMVAQIWNNTSNAYDAILLKIY